jgi:hypothetical protein
MLSENFPTHIHWVPARHGVLMFHALKMMQQYANDLYNQGTANQDKTMQDMAARLIVECQDCIHRQFDGYSLDHLSQPVFTNPKRINS